MKKTYHIMHQDKTAARIDMQGHCAIYEPGFMPYNLFLDDTQEDLDTLVNNVTKFLYWCATRILTFDRQYAKEILNSIGMAQAVTDRDRAKIALTYGCVSLTDVFWVKEEGDQRTFEQINLYDNHLSNAFIDVALRGRQMTVQDDALVPDLATSGCFPKAWLRTEQGVRLLKDGDPEAVKNELLASRVCQCFSCRQVVYEEALYEGITVTSSALMTSKDKSIVTRAAFEIYAANREIEPLSYILKLDSYSYYMMNLLDYLVGNTDRHWENWGLLIDNATNEPVSLHPLMDFNRAFHAYQTLDGANCQTTLPRQCTQREAAIEAVRRIGLNQCREIEKEWFQGREAEYGMLMQRLQLLKQEQE